MAKAKLAKGDWVQVTGSSAWMTPEPVQIIGFGLKDDNGLPVVDLSDGQWAYETEVAQVPAPANKKEMK